MTRFKDFSDAEVYMLHRSVLEASAQIVISDRYNNYEIKLHSELLNELTQERKERNI